MDLPGRGALTCQYWQFKSVGQAQRFLDLHAAVGNLFNLGRHLVSASHYRDLREGVFKSWERAVA
jgi:putative transposase